MKLYNNVFYTVIVIMLLCYYNLLIQAILPGMILYIFYYYITMYYIFLQKPAACPSPPQAPLGVRLSVHPLGCWYLNVHLEHSPVVTLAPQAGK